MSGAMASLFLGAASVLTEVAEVTEFEGRSPGIAAAPLLLLLLLCWPAREARTQAIIRSWYTWCVRVAVVSVAD